MRERLLHDYGYMGTIDSVQLVVRDYLRMRKYLN